MIEKIKDILFAISHPRFWLRIYPVSKTWDKKLKQLMKEHKFEKNIGDFTVRLGKHEIWVANHPYASFRNYNDPNSYLPKRRTTHKAMKKLIEET